MKAASKFLVASLLLVTCLAVDRAFAQSPEVMTNDSIVQMVTGKVAKDVILAKIHSTSNTFDISASGLVALTKSKVDRDVISAMITAKSDNKEVLTNDQVVVMVTGNVARDVIIFKIHSTKSKFDLTAAGLVGLSQNKVPQDIVKAMLNVADTAPAEEPPPPPPAAPPARSGASATGRGTPPAAAAADKQAPDATQAVTFASTEAVKTVYDKIKNLLTKTADTAIQQIDPVLGQITAVKTRKEGTTEHESRMVIKVTATAGHSTVKVLVFDKTRKIAAPPGRWGVEKFDADLTSILATDLKTALQGK